MRKLLIAMQMALTLLSLLYPSLAETRAVPQETISPEYLKLRDKDPLRRIEAILDIASKKPRPETATALVNCIINDDNSYVRLIASDVLASMRTYARDLAPRMLATLEDHAADAGRRARAAQVLGAIGGEAPQSIKPLINNLEDTQQPPMLREAIAVALLAFVRLPADSVPGVEQIAFNSRENLRLRELVLQALGSTGRDAVSAITQLSIILRDRTANLSLREQAADSLGAIGDDGQTESPAKVLIPVLGDNTEPLDLRIQAASSLQRMGSMAEDALPVLRDLATQNQPRELRLAALDAMQRIGQGTHRFSVDLAKIAATSGVDPEIRVKAAQALGSVGAEPTQAAELASLAQDLRQPPELRRAAVDSIRVENATAKQSMAKALISILSEPKQDPDVRTQAAQILAQVKPIYPEVVTNFIKVIGDPNEDIVLRRGVAYAAGIAGLGAADAVPTLAEALRDSPDLMLRRQSCWALMAIRRNGDGAVSALETIIRSGGADSELRRTAVSALGAIGSDDKTIDPDVVPVLLNILRNATDPQMRRNVPAYLGQMEVGGTDAVSVLGKIVGDIHEDPQLRTGAASALGNIGRDQNVSQTLPAMLQVLRSDQEQRELRQSVANTLTLIQPRPQTAIPTLIKVIRESSDSQMRSSAANALGVIGEGSRTAAATLATIISDRYEENNLRATAAMALGKTGAVAKTYLHSLLDALKNEETSYAALQGFVSFGDQAATDGDTASIGILKQAEAEAAATPALANMRNIGGGNYIVQLQQSITSLEAQAFAQKKHTEAHILDAAIQHPIISCGFGFLLICLLWFLICGFLLVFRPISLLKISDFSFRLEEEKIWANFHIVTIPLGWVILLPYMRFHPSSLDAWVLENAPKVRVNFATLPTVSEREVYVDLPVKINTESVPRFGPESLQETFRQPRTLILVTGEGGAGKTSVACQIGRWAAANAGSAQLSDHVMLPLMIEGDIAQATTSTEVLQETIRGQLRLLLNQAEAPSKPMVESLLRHKRVLVIVDGFSEMNAASRAAIRPLDPTFPVHALLITSRQEESISGLGQTTIRPERLGWGSLGAFMESYLTKSRKLGLLTLQQFQDYAADLQRLVGEREVTPLFAKLYINLIVSLKEEHSENPLPRTIPELILEYLNYLNRNIASNKKENHDVQELAKDVAWACVIQNLRPAPAKISEVLSSLGGGQQAEENLRYLEKRLVLIQTLWPGEEVRFTLDPLAEYLAALRLTDKNGIAEERWRDFFGDVDRASGSGSTVRGFLEAVSDCYHWRYPTKPADDFVGRELRIRLS